MMTKYEHREIEKCSLNKNSFLVLAKEFDQKILLKDDPQSVQSWILLQ